MKTLLIVYHSHGVKTRTMAEAVARGAQLALDEVGAAGELRIVIKHCADAGPEDMLAADAILFGTPETFGSLSGMMKDFLERVFYPCEGRLAGRAYAVFVGSGQDGSGAVVSIDRIVTGLRLKKVHAGVIGLKELTPEVIGQCEELGATVAAGLAAGVM